MMIGQLLGGRYRVIQELGGGGFAKTYLVEDSNLPNRRQCVVKHLCPPNKEPKTIRVARQLFAQEAATLERLGHHEQIPLIFDYFEDQKNQEFYIVEEFIPGDTLAKEILPGQPLPEIRVINLLTKVLEILVFVHEQGVIHRDIKPANLMRRQTDGKIFLIDFGTVKEVTTHIVNSQGQITSTIAVGTPSYMPIEQFHGNPQFNSDIYALGVVAIQALTGLLADDISKLRDPKNPSTGEIRWRHRTQVSPLLADIIDRMVSIDCRQRYQSATQVLLNLNRLSPPTQPVQPIQPPRSQQRWLWLALAGAVAVFSGLGWKLFPKPAQQCQAYDQGLEATKKQDFQTAIYDFNQCIQNNPQDAQSYFKRGYAYYGQKDYNKAIEDYNQALDLFGQQKNLIGVGLRVKKQDDMLIVDRVYPESPALTAGVKVGDQIQEIDDRSTTSMSQQEATSLINQGQVNTQVTLKIYHQGGDQLLKLNRELVVDNIRAKVYVNRGLALSAQGKTKAAIDDYNQSLNIQPNNAEAYYERAHAHFDQGDQQGAINDYTQALRIAPNYIEAHVGRGSARFDQGDKQGAIDDYTQAIQINADSIQVYGPSYVNKLHADAYNSRGYAKYQLADLPGAIGDYTQAINLNHDSAEAYYNRAIARSNIGDKGAVDDFQQAANLYLDRGDTKRYNDALSQNRKLRQPNAAIVDKILKGK